MKHSNSGSKWWTVAESGRSGGRFSPTCELSLLWTLRQCHNALLHCCPSVARKGVVGSFFLVGGWTNPSEKYQSNSKIANRIGFPKDRGEHKKKYLKPQASFVLEMEWFGLKVYAFFGVLLPSFFVANGPGHPRNRKKMVPNPGGFRALSSSWGKEGLQPKVYQSITSTEIFFPRNIMKPFELWGHEKLWHTWGFPKMVVPNNHGFSY